MPVLEALVALAIIGLAGSVVHRWMKDRQEIKKLRAQMEAAKGAEKIVETMMLDKDMAGEIYERLGAALEAKKKLEGGEER
jgi:type II secretory pathway pseudopilin PulG